MSRSHSPSPMRVRAGWRRVLSAALAVAMGWTVLASPARSDEGVKTTDLGALRRGHPLFVDVANTRVLATPDCTKDNCWRYRFDVQPGGKDLRIAVEASRRGDFWTMRITDPDGNPVSGNPFGNGGNAPFAYVPGTGLGLYRWAIEHRLADPKPGAWTVQVTLQDTEVGLADVGEPARMRLRAALDPLPQGVSGLPNLRVRAPYEFGLAAPGNPTSGAAVDRQNFALSAGGVEPASCAWDEIEQAVEHGEAPPTRCLRFSVGVYEAGEGRLELQMDGYDGGFTGAGDVTQRIHQPGGQIEERNAGQWEFHKFHGHEHYLGFVRYEVERVRFDAGEPVLLPEGRSSKTGFYTADQRMADWSSFAQDPQWAAITGCEQRCIAMGAGWEDHYRWQRTGQYVPLGLGTAGDGLYVVRIRVNADGLLAETTTADNTAYALVHVAGGAVAVCERGLGDHPWAANAEPVTDQWPALRAGAPTSSGGCPSTSR